MSEQDKESGTPQEPTGTTAEAVGGSGTPEAGGSSGPSAEELAKQLAEAQDALQREKNARAQLLAERSNVEAMRREMEARQAGSTPPTPAAADPLAQQLAMLQQTAIEVMSAVQLSPNDPALRAQAVTLASQINMTQMAMQQRDEQSRWQRLNGEVMALPEGIRSAVAQKLSSGEFTSVQAAREAVEGSAAAEQLTELKARMDALETENKKLKDRGPVAEVSTSLGGRGAVRGPRTVLLSDYQRIMNAGGAEAKRLLNELDSGIVTLQR